jgi:two-component system chemotaxis sensor kinase CheA
MSMDLSQFHGAFFEESFEALDSMETALLKLNVGAPDPELIGTIFRVAHSIKGGSATFGFNEVTSFTHTCETLLDELRGKRMQVTAQLSDLLLKAVDVIRAMLRAVQHKEPVDAQRVADLQFDLEVAILNKELAPAPVAATVAAAPAAAVVPPTATKRHRFRILFRPYPPLLVHGNDPLRMLRELEEIGDVSVTADVESLPAFADLNPEVCLLSWEIQLDTNAEREVVKQIFEWAEGDCDLEFFDESAALAAAAIAATPESIDAEHATDAKPAAAAPGVPPEHEERRHGDSSSIRVSTEKIDELMNTVGELVITQSMLGQLGGKFDGPAADQLRSGLVQLERNMRELQESVMRVRMLPISFVFSRFPRMVRDLSQRLDKQIDLKLSGEQTELDKTVLEKIGDPLVHLVRNCVDHGIEMPAVRLAAGKTAVGTLHLDAYHRGGNISIEVSDDGGGLNKERILAKARSLGLVDEEVTPSDSEICDLIFAPGFSTAAHTTDISGRGVGMDVVRRNVKELGGSIEVRTEYGKGTRFVITLPLTLAIVDGQSVSVGGETYIVPLLTIIESLQLKPGAVNRVAGGGEVFWFRDAYVPVLRLHEVFGATPRAQHLHEGLIMVVEGEGRRVGLFVDELLGQQQVVIKSLETNFRRVEGVSGATILGDGSVALILDVPGVIKVASQRAAA